ncbi:MAG: vWA domain-containing protein [Cellvibrionaceae bacterium]
MFQFAWAWVFLLLPLPILCYYFIKPVKRETSAVIVPFYQQLKASVTQNTFTGLYRQWLSIIVLSLIWILLIVASARPQWVGDPVALSTSGRDLLLAVDISDSMDQADMIIDGENVTRLQAVKKVVAEFIERRKGDRIGLVLFGTNAYLQTPLTFDVETVSQFLQEAQLGFAGPKTAIGDAIGLSVKRLKELENKNRVLILLTDGANTAGEVEPMQAAVLAQQTGIKTYTVGIGADEMVIRGFFGPRRINPSAQLDEKTLVNIAEITGGQYFRARETDQLENIYQQLDKLEPVNQEQQWLRPTRSLFIWPLFFAMLLGGLLILNHIKSPLVIRGSS